WTGKRRRARPAELRASLPTAPSLFPAVQMRAERLALLAHHAEAVAAGRFHHPPGVNFLDLPRAERDQALRLGLDVVGLDVQMDARGMRDLLQQQDRFVGGGMQARVLAVVVLVERVDALAEGL